MKKTFMFAVDPVTVEIPDGYDYFYSQPNTVAEGFCMKGDKYYVPYEKKFVDIPYHPDDPFHTDDELLLSTYILVIRKKITPPVSPVTMLKSNLLTALELAIYRMEDEKRGNITFTNGLRDIVDAIKAGKEIVIKD